MSRENDLNELVKRLREALGANLTAAVLYGSAAADEFHEEHSDLNILCLFERLDAAELAKLRPVGLVGGGASAAIRRRWYGTRSRDGSRDSADVFAIELLDMQQRHRMLAGRRLSGATRSAHDAAPLAGGTRAADERHPSAPGVSALAGRTRGTFGADDRVVLDVCGAGFRHALIALGEAAPDSRRGALDQLGRRLGFDSGAVHTVFDLREGARRPDEVNHDEAFAAYLNAVTRVAEEMDRRLAAKP